MRGPSTLGRRALVDEVGDRNSQRSGEVVEPLEENSPATMLELDELVTA